MNEPADTRVLKQIASDGPPPDTELTTVMAQLARALERDHDDVDAVLTSICEAAQAGIPGTEQAGITVLLGAGKFGSHGATGTLPAEMDQLQAKLAQGPCVDAARGDDVVRVDDMSTESRWPEFSPAAAAVGVGSMLSFQLWTDTEYLGALNLYSKSPDAFEPSSESIGLPLAAHAAVALSGARRERQLRAAIDSRDVIGQAKGMLMQRFSINADEAFNLMTRLSQETNRKTREIAERITTDGLD